MATALTPTAAIAIPSDAHAFVNVSPRGVDLEGRLDLSLDALIKERKKEHKLLKKQEAKNPQQKQSADKRKAPKQQKPQQQKQQTVTKTGQKAQRKALMNKNRGLSTVSPAAKEKATQGKTKTSIAATTAKLRRQMRADKTKVAGRLVVSPKATKGTKQNSTAQQSKKKKNAPQQTRKNAKNQQVVKQQPKAQGKASVRQVMRANNKKAKLSVTITGQASNKSQKKQKVTNKVVLPGKLSQSLGKKAAAAKKVVKRTKNRKETAAKATKVVRQVPRHRKKN